MLILGVGIQVRADAQGECEAIVPGAAVTAARLHDTPSRWCPGTWPSLAYRKEASSQRHRFWRYSSCQAYECELPSSVLVLPA